MDLLPNGLITTTLVVTAAGIIFTIIAAILC